MLKVKNITFAYNKNAVLSGIDFEVHKGEHISVIGESGSGKSTLLKLIYGEHDLDKGQIFWKDTEILGPKSNLVVGYDIMKYVAQEFDLMPFISLEENIGKHLSNFFPKEKKERVKELLDLVELSDFGTTKVKNLSGGQKQRVALARALAKQPEIILLDEPFSHIDNFKKRSLRRNIFNFLKHNDIACIVASHDPEDVLGYADRIIVLHQTKIIANDTPHRLYNNPERKLIASFFGEFNDLKNEGIVYAHQLKVVDNSNFEVKIKKSYYRGNYFLIEADFEGIMIRFEHPTSLENGSKVYLKIIK